MRVSVMNSVSAVSTAVASTLDSASFLVLLIAQISPSGAFEPRMTRFSSIVRNCPDFLGWPEGIKITTGLFQ